MYRLLCLLLLCVPAASSAAQERDGDGDTDIITSEERENLGVIWYENPAR